MADEVTTPAGDRSGNHPAGSPASRQISWWPVYEYLRNHGYALTGHPIPGTPQWCELDDDDPAKLNAIVAYGLFFTLHLDTHQEALADASKTVAAAENWGHLAQRIHGRGDAYIPRIKEAS